MNKSNIIDKFSEITYSKFTSKATLKTYNSLCVKFVYDNHPDSIDKLTKDHLLAYLNQFNPSSYNQYLSVFKILYRDVFNQKQKLKDVKPIKIKRKLKNIPKTSNINKVLKGIDNIKHYCIIFMFATTGIRMDELLNVRILDVNSEKMNILILNGKGGRSRFVSMNRILLEKLQEYYKIYKPKYYLFEGRKGDKYTDSSINKFIKKHFGEEYHAHLFRHYWFTYMINNDVNSSKIRHAGGHRCQKSQQIGIINILKMLWSMKLIQHKN